MLVPERRKREIPLWLQQGLHTIRIPLTSPRLKNLINLGFLVAYQPKATFLATSYQLSEVS